MILAQCHVGVTVVMSEQLTSSSSLYVFSQQFPILAPSCAADSASLHRSWSRMMQSPVRSTYTLCCRHRSAA